MAALPIDPGMAAGEVLRRYPQTLEVFDHHGVVFCAGCFLTLFDPLGDVAGYHAVHDVPALLADLNRAASLPEGERPVWALGSGPGPTRLGKALAQGVRRRVEDTLQADAAAAALGIRLVDLRHGSARAAAEGTAASEPAAAAALAVFAARATHLGMGRADGPLRNLSLAPLALETAEGLTVAEAHGADDAVEDGRASAYHVRLVRRDASVVGIATVLLAGRV